MQSIIQSQTGYPLPQNFSEMADSLEWWGRVVDCHWQQNVLGLMYLCLKEVTFVGRKKLFDFSIGMLVDMKIEERSPCDIPLLLKEDWLDYFNTSLNNASFFTCTMRTIQYIDKRINNFITEQNTVVIVLDVIHSE